MDDLVQIVESAKADFAVAEQPAALEDAKARYLGKSGSLTALMRGLGALSPEEKRTRGQAINRAKAEVEAALNARREALAEMAMQKKLAAEAIDVSLPGRTLARGGVHPATREFMTGLRKLCDEKGMLLLLDEVQTGWCRTGAVMSYMNYGIKPDIVSMAKALGGGMPIGAICATAEAAKAFTPGSHGTTFGGHPVSCAAALAEVEELLDRGLAGNAKKVGEYFMKELHSLPHVKEVRGQGLLVGVEFDSAVNAVDVKHTCFKKKLLITAIGDRVIRMVPPLIVTEADCDKAVSIIREAVKELTA